MHAERQMNGYHSNAQQTVKETDIDVFYVEDDVRLLVTEEKQQKWKKWIWVTDKFIALQ